MNKKIYNFSAGPAMLPEEVLKKVKKNFLNWNNIGASIIEISHRSIEFNEIIKNSKKYLKELLNIPKEYVILFCQGGARGQFSAIPMNLLNKFNCADYINSGYWSYQAFLEAKKYCFPNNIYVREYINGKISISNMKKWLLHKNSDYIHYCPNETIEGISIYEEPNFKDKIVIGDFSSYLLSQKINIKKYDLIYASAQKNLGPSGITIVIIKKSLLEYKNSDIPSILNYKKNFLFQSMLNTPVTFSWYIISLVLKWVKKKGGIDYFEKINIKKSNLLYQKIDDSNFYINNIHSKNRSRMNITFQLKNKKLNDLFLKEANKFGLKFLKGHKIIGGFRASIYNAMPLSGVEKLVSFMIDFENKFK
ncbi:3-phosphoserine/phosphohydroxythreonine transaminase [Buchnera aphidicola]|uniref:Phosphoserine aminotransferase n=1 Tax=Buchnera aphidicola (Therioaphis trifolii) TaxID=1241884 RepID=A0A4D6YKG1_9GAMM|nr:3-phosphoserine/phosphohydroxythreonine transaminase [Buchnera aphidicola]QCI27211.1 3-phosphoserine/phosphohydroxythreonine transaminase [Buchnera aphidicola (Therioaphis trifolii)]